MYQSYFVNSYKSSINLGMVEIVNIFFAVSMSTCYCFTDYTVTMLTSTAHHSTVTISNIARSVSLNDKNILVKENFVPELPVMRNH